MGRLFRLSESLFIMCSCFPWCWCCCSIYACPDLLITTIMSFKASEMKCTVMPSGQGDKNGGRKWNSSSFPPLITTTEVPLSKTLNLPRASVQPFPGQQIRLWLYEVVSMCVTVWVWKRKPCSQLNLSDNVKVKVPLRSKMCFSSCFYSWIFALHCAEWFMYGQNFTFEGCLHIHRLNVEISPCSPKMWV